MRSLGGVRSNGTRCLIMSGFEVAEGSLRSLPWSQEAKKAQSEARLLYTEKTSGTNKMFAFLGGLKPVSDPDEAMQGKTKKLTVSLGRHEFVLFVQQQPSHFKELNGSYG